MEDFKYILINKNRGWRGLAEAEVYNYNEKRTTVLKMIFSFSQPVWDDLINNGKLVMQDEEHYYVLYFDVEDRASLPKPTQQRSVLIKNWKAPIRCVNKYDKTSWPKARYSDWQAITNFIKNSNNHTTSDWNCIGIRVIPKI